MTSLISWEDFITALRDQQCVTEGQLEGAVWSMWHEGRIISDYHGKYNNYGEAIIPKAAAELGRRKSWLYNAWSMFRFFPSESLFQSHLNNYSTPTISAIVKALPRKSLTADEKDINVDEAASGAERGAMGVEKQLNAVMTPDQKEELGNASRAAAESLLSSSFTLGTLSTDVENPGEPDHLAPDHLAPDHLAPEEPFTDVENPDVPYHNPEWDAYEEPFTEKECKILWAYLKTGGCYITGGEPERCHFPVSKGAGADDSQVIPMTTEMHLAQHEGIDTFISMYGKMIILSLIRDRNYFFRLHMSQAEEGTR